MSLRSVLFSEDEMKTNLPQKCFFWLAEYHTFLFQMQPYLNVRPHFTSNGTRAKNRTVKIYFMSQPETQAEYFVCPFYYSFHRQNTAVLANMPAICTVYTTYFHAKIRFQKTQIASIVLC